MNIHALKHASLNTLITMFILSSIAACNDGYTPGTKSNSKNTSEELMGSANSESSTVPVTTTLRATPHIESTSNLARPPQFVVIAFDGSYNIRKWNETRELAKNSRLKLTYFISGAYYLANAHKMKYIEPSKGAGASAIGFGGDIDSLYQRIDQTNAAHDEGHEIASHANGHFSGESWSEAQWTQEFHSFNSLVFDIFKLNGMQPRSQGPTGWAFKNHDIVGFRAPQLGKSAGLWPSLNKFGFRYDTSRTSTPNYWPAKINGLWNFPLAEIRIAGSGIKTLSMDYNFYVAQSGGNPKVENTNVYEKQMLDTYLQYFQNNYAGNRAPIHIGHHFSDWNGGAYWRALNTFTQRVCKLPEVKCVTYKELMAFMDARTPEDLKYFQNGNFSMSRSIPDLARNTERPFQVDASLKSSGRFIEARFQGADATRLMQDGSRVVWKLNGRSFAEGPVLDSNQLGGISSQGAELSASLVKNGRDLSRATHKINDEFAADGSRLFELSSSDLESRGLIGDLPEAHLDETHE